MVDPDVDTWGKFGTYLPFLFVRSDNRARSDSASVGAAATAALDGSAPFTDTGSDVCWAFSEGGVTVAAKVHTMADPPRGACRGRPGRPHRQPRRQGLEEWLRLSNWLGLSDRHRVSTYSLLSAAPLSASTVSDDATLPAEWQSVFNEAVSDGERDLICALAEAGAAVPALDTRPTMARSSTSRGPMRASV